MYPPDGSFFGKPFQKTISFLNKKMTEMTCLTPSTYYL